jgi:ribonuclease HII
MILGIDEVGRGPWAGPLVVGAVVLDGPIDGLTDSKKLSKKRREELDVIIREQAAGYGLGWVSAAELDEIGLSEALKLATRRAVEQVRAPYHEIIIDGTVNFLAGTAKGEYVTTMKKADLLIASVSAASIIAKVARDNYMTEQNGVYEGYGFGAHVGYGTAAHRAAIEKLGVTPLHRLSFAPLQKYQRPVSGPVGTSAPKIFQITEKIFGAAPRAATRASERPEEIVRASNFRGALAEDEVADYLVRHGHEIMERNWKTKYCEIDIVSAKDGTIYFTEAKYRKQANQGGGLAAITPKKLERMKFAAAVYIQTKKLQNTDVLLAVATLTGEPPVVEEWFVLH